MYEVFKDSQATMVYNRSSFYSFRGSRNSVVLYYFLDMELSAILRIYGLDSIVLSMITKTTGEDIHTRTKTFLKRLFGDINVHGHECIRALCN